MESDFDALTEAPLIPDDVVRAVSTNDRAARERLLRVLEPSLRRRLRKVANAHARRCGRALHAADLDDLYQELQLTLWVLTPRLAARWDPARGLSFEALCGLVAERKLYSFLRSRRRCPTRSFAQDSFDELPDPHDLEREAVARAELTRVLEKLRASARAEVFEMFCDVVLDGCPVSGASQRFNRSDSNVYTTISRLRALVKAG